MLQVIGDTRGATGKTERARKAGKEVKNMARGYGLWAMGRAEHETRGERGDRSRWPRLPHESSAGRSLGRGEYLPLSKISFFHPV